MTDTDQEAQDRQARAEQEQAERLERRRERDKRYATSATDTWKFEQEDFRRMMRTGEFTQTPDEPEPQPETAKAE